VLHRAERELDHRVPADEPEWIYYFDELELSGEAAHCARDLGQAKDTRRTDSSPGTRGRASRRS
jgi:hypothetical protein